MIFCKQDAYFLHAAYQVLLNKMSPNKTVITISARKPSQFVCAINESKVVILYSTNDFYDFFKQESFPIFSLEKMTLFHVVHLYH